MLKLLTLPVPEVTKALATVTGFAKLIDHLIIICGPAAAAFDPQVASKWQRNIERASRAVALSRECTLCHRRLRLRTISPAGVQMVVVNVKPTPDDHFTAGPDCRVIAVGGVGALVVLVAVQLSVLGIVSPAGVQRGVTSHHSAPDDHFTAGPDCRVTDSGSRARWWCWWLSNYPCWDCISRRCSNRRCSHTSAPDDHFTAGPDCRVTVLGQWARWWCWWLSNYPCWDCISRQCSKSCRHHLRPRRSFHCRSTLPCDRLGQRARWWCWWLSNCPCWDCISRRCSR